MVIKKSNTWLLYIITGLNFFKSQITCLNNHWVFHETQQYFEVFENTQNRRFFESDFIFIFSKIPQPGCSLILKILKCLESTVL